MKLQGFLVVIMCSLLVQLTAVVFMKYLTSGEPLLSSSDHSVLSKSNVLGIPTPGSSGWCLLDQVSYTEVWHYSYCCQLVVAVCFYAETPTTERDGRGWSVREWRGFWSWCLWCCSHVCPDTTATDSEMRQSMYKQWSKTRTRGG